MSRCAVRQSSLLCLFLIALAQPRDVPAEQTMMPKLAILEIQLQKIDPELGTILTGVISAEIAELGTHEVITSQDVAAMLKYESQKDLLNCQDVSCMAEIGGALGADYILSTSVGKVGSATYVINMALLNSRSNK